MLETIEELREMADVLEKEAWYIQTAESPPEWLRAALIEEFACVRASLGRLFNSLDYETRMAVIVRQNLK